MRIDKVETIVEEILEKHPRTRTSDHLLYRAYHYELLQRRKVSVDFETFFTYPETYDACSFSTIERCRRRIQYHRPELRDPKTAIQREYKQQEFKDYAIKEKKNG